jgi:hypothetical protein
MTHNGQPLVNGVSDEAAKKASLYQVIEELILSEHARYLSEDCGIDLTSSPQVEDPEGKNRDKDRP